MLHAFWNNRGDESALRAMIDSFITFIPNINITIMFMADVVDLPYKDIHIIKMFPHFKKNLSVLPLLIDILLTFISFGKLAFTQDAKEFIKAVEHADIVIHAPGGPSIGDLASGYGGIINLYRLMVPIIKNKPLFFYAPSMGPFSGRFLNFFRKIVLNKANALIVREEFSAKYLMNQLGITPYVTIDSAFQNNIPYNYLQRYSSEDSIDKILELIEKEKVVGVVAADFFWHDVYRYDRDKIINAFLKTVEYVIKKGYFVLLIPNLFEKNGFEDKEFILLETIRELNKKSIIIIPSYIDAYGQQAIISKLYSVISVRYHPIIYAAKANIPFIALSYQFKIDGLIEKLDCSNLLINLDEIDETKIIEKFDYLEKNHDNIKEHLNKKVPNLKKDSQKTTKIILGKIKELNLLE